MDAFTIKDIENLSGVKAHTIRIWEQRYGFLKPQRTDTNIRFYNNEELKAILNISLLNKHGYKISQISRMSGEEMKERILSLSPANAQQERIIHDLIRFMVDLDVFQLENTLDTYVQKRGIREMIQQIIFPFLEKIGVLWSTGRIHPAQEHLVSNIIRQKLIVGINSLPPVKDSNPIVLLFLPETEFHELGLLFMYFLLKSNGINTLYLGANVPVSDVEYVAKHKHPDFIYTHLTSLSNSFRFDKYLNQLTSALADDSVVLSGKLAQTCRIQLPQNVRCIHSLAEAEAFVQSLSGL